MGKYEDIYQRLRKEYSDEEITDAMLIPADLTAEEQEEAREEIRAFRRKVFSDMTEEQRIYADILRFRYQMEEYIEKHEYADDMTFGKQLEEYIRILKKTRKEISEELAVHYTKLSRIINDRENPNIAFMYRLEEHAAGLIPALVWWKLWIKKQEYDIKKDQTTRQAEATKVTRAIAR